MRVLLAMITVGVLGIGSFAMAGHKETKKKACINAFNTCMEKAVNNDQKAVCSDKFYICINEAEGRKIRVPIS